LQPPLNDAARFEPLIDAVDAFYHCMNELIAHSRSVRLARWNRTPPSGEGVLSELKPYLGKGVTLLFCLPHKKEGNEERG
jgi:hypothetical protein